MGRSPTQLLREPYRLEDFQAAFEESSSTPQRRNTIHLLSDIIYVFGQLVDSWTHVIDSMDASQRLQTPTASVVSRTDAGATPHQTHPPTAGIHVGNVNKSIIADTVQNAQDVNFGNLISRWRGFSRGPLTVL